MGLVSLQMEVMWCDREDRNKILYIYILPNILKQSDKQGKNEDSPCITNTNFVSFVRNCVNNQSKSHMNDDSTADFRFGASISSEKVMSRSVRGCEEIHVRLTIPSGYWRVEFGGAGREFALVVFVSAMVVFFGDETDRGDLVLVRRERGGGEIEIDLPSSPLLRLSWA
jgi:hypothetical protein